MLKRKPFFSLNPVVGCSFGCLYCYAEKLNKRFPQITTWNKPQFFENRLETLYKRKKASLFFMTTMSDPADWLPAWTNKIEQAMKDNPHHIYLFLSKRPESFSSLGQCPNTWLGCTITCREDLHRLKELRTKPAAGYFISFEPLFEDLGSLNLAGYHWAWIGAETGNRHNKIICKKEWVKNIIDQCQEQSIPFSLQASLKEVYSPPHTEFPKDFYENSLFF